MDEHLRSILSAAVAAVEPANAVRRHLARADGVLRASSGWQRPLRDAGPIVLIASGKAAAAMAEAVVPLIADKLVRGLVVTKYGHVPAATPLTAPELGLTLIEAGHPVPDENSLRAGAAAIEAVGGLDPKALIVACISGGASALMAAPIEGMSLNSLRAVNAALLRSGADIREMNVVRAALDRLKAGGLVRAAQPAGVLSLILSDVIGDPLDVIASGLTHHPLAHNVLVGNNTQACEAAAAAASALGYDARIVTTDLRGEASERGREIARAVAGLDARAPAALIYGGEPTVTLRGDGLGGRNQELALAAAIELDTLGAQGCVIASLGTDGTDGPTDAAGAVAAPDTLARARAAGLDAADSLARNDSYRFFQALGDLIITGPTGTNVADVVVALKPR